MCGVKINQYKNYTCVTDMFHKFVPPPKKKKKKKATNQTNITKQTNKKQNKRKPTTKTKQRQQTNKQDISLQLNSI